MSSIELRRRKEDRLPWFPFWIDRWETDLRVRQMGPAARGIFLSLLLLQWREGSIPSDPLVLLRLTHMPTDPMRSALEVGAVKNPEHWGLDLEACLEQALACFVPDGKGGLHNETLAEIWTEQDGKRDVSIENGRLGGLRKASNRLAGLEPSYKLATSKPLAKPSELEVDLDLNPNTKSKASTKAPSAFQLPDWVPQEAWDHYEEMRQKIRKPMTDQARKWAVGQLERLKARGNDVGQVIEQSVGNSWQGLFPLREDVDGKNGSGRGNPAKGPGTQVARAFNNFAALATVVRGCDRLAASERGAGVDHPRLSDGTGQEARPGATHDRALEKGAGGDS